MGNKEEARELGFDRVAYRRPHSRGSPTIDQFLSASLRIDNNVQRKDDAVWVRVRKVASMKTETIKRTQSNNWKSYRYHFK